MKRFWDWFATIGMWACIVGFAGCGAAVELLGRHDLMPWTLFFAMLWMPFWFLYIDIGRETEILKEGPKIVEQQKVVKNEN